MMFLIILIIFWQCSICFAQLLEVPLGDELYREVYDFIDRVVARQDVTKVFKNILPYSNADVAQALIELDKRVKEGHVKLSEIEQRRLNQLLSLLSLQPHPLLPLSTSGEGVGGRGFSEHSHLFITQGDKHSFYADFGVGENLRIRETDEEKTAYATLFRPTVGGQIRDDFAFYSDLKVYYISAAVDKDFPKTEARIAQYPVKSKTGALTTYYMKFKLPWFDVFLGKDNLHWGPGIHGALLLSENPLPMNMVKLTAQYYPVKFQAVTALLGSDIARKYLSGHRVELNLFEKLRLGVAEVIVYGERFETIYLNPLQIYTVTEIPAKVVSGESKESPDNTLISGDFDLALVRNFQLYGEILIDDFRPFAYGLRSYRNWGSKFGLLSGFYYVDPFSLPNTDFRVEYAFINQYTYTHTPSVTAYTHFDSIIGHQIGTDADDLWLNLKHWFTPNFTASLSYELERHGEGNVNKPHPSGAPDDDEWEFLSGVTESTHSITLGASYNLIGKYSATLEYTHSWIKNTNHQVGVNDTNNQVLLSGQYRF
jgi:hypothetical protein